MDKLCNKNISKYFCYLILGVTLLFCLTLIIKVQFLTPTLYGADGYQHIRLAEIIKNSGPIHEFPWAEYSIWANRFADKDFLFHLILP